MKKRKSNKPVSNEELFKRALSFETPGAFSKGDRSAYTLCHKRRILKEACSHMISGTLFGENHPKFRHTDAAIEKKARSCKTKKEFRKKYPSEYVLAHNRGIFNKITDHVVEANPAGDEHSNKKHTHKKLKKIALLYDKISLFREHDFDSYMAIYRRGLLEDLCGHMTDSIGENHPLALYTNSYVIKEGSKYRSQGEFLKENPNLYRVAWKRKLLDKIVFPNSNYTGSSLAEIDLFNVIKALYPKAQKFWDRKVKIEGKPHIHGFELDIYIPELRKGIEFDGRYHHSFEGLKRGRPNWPDEDLINYQKIKDFWFANKGIEILHIKETDWDLDRQACVDQCLKFLEVSLKEVA